MNHEGLQHEKRIAVLGGGIAGLAAARRLCQQPRVSVTLFEAIDRLGGSLCTEQVEGFTIEHGADMFLADTATPWALELAREIGLGEELIGTRQQDRGARVALGGKLLPVPAGFQLAGPAKVWPVLQSPILSWPAKLRLARERFVPARGELAEEETVAQFITRRLGRETYERLVEPLAAGIFTADGTRLSAPAALPQFVAMEREHGSLTKGLAARARQAQSDGSAAGARYGKFLAPREGMGRLAAALAAALPANVIKLRTPVQSLRQCEGGWEVVLAETTETFDALVIALPAYRAAEVLGSVSMALAGELAGIEYASSVVAVLAYREEQLTNLPRCFGFVVPASEGRPIVAASFASTKFEQRAPAGHVNWCACSWEARCGPRWCDLPEEELLAIARQQLAELIGATGEPVLTRLTRWRRAMPQYHVGHLGRVERIEARAAELPGFALAGAAFRGVGVPQCIHSGQQAAEQVVRELAELETKQQIES